MRSSNVFVLVLLVTLGLFSNLASATYSWHLPTIYINAKTKDGHPVQYARFGSYLEGSYHYVGKCPGKGLALGKYRICKQVHALSSTIVETDENGNAGVPAKNLHIKENDNTLRYLLLGMMIVTPERGFVPLGSNYGEVPAVKASCTYHWKKPEAFQNQMHCVLDITKEDLDKRIADSKAW